jgi:hypothetical protein
MPFTAYTQPIQTVVPATSSEQNAPAPPPISQPLIREGDFAINLVSALNLGTANSGPEAETILTSAGIAPKNGWISDYPVTPVVIGQLEQSIEAAANAGKLPMDAGKAVKAFQTLVADEGLPVQVASGSGSGEGTANYGEYSNPTVINNYYYNEGPPVITYYPPPPDYLYLYTWVTYPFWWAGFWFSGYYCLNDFDVVVVVHHVRKICTNHFTDPVTRRVVLISPRTLGFERAVHAGRELGPRQWKEHAGAIYRHNLERPPTRNGVHSRGYVERRISPFSRAQRMEQPRALNHSTGRNSERRYQSLPNPPMTSPGKRSFHNPEGYPRNFHSPSAAGRSEGFHGGGSFSQGFHDGFGGRSLEGSRSRGFSGFHGGFHGGLGHPRG